MNYPLSISTSPKKSSVDQKDQNIQKYIDGKEYPIIWYDPDIILKENEIWKTKIQENNSISLFSRFQEAFPFIQALGTSFLLITPNEFEKEIVLNNFGALKDTYGRRYFDFEQEAVLMSLFKEISEERMKSLEVYVFFTRQDFLNEAPVSEEEEEVMIMCGVKEMAEQLRQDFTILWYDPNLNPESNKILVKEFDIEEKNIYSDFKGFYQRLHDQKEVPYHLILTGKLEAEKIVSEMGRLRDLLLCLYIYDVPDEEVFKIKSRKIEVSKTLKELIPRIREGIRTTPQLNQFPAFAQDFDDWDKSHLNKLHYYLRGLINFKNRRQAKRDFISLAKRFYQSQQLVEFETEYYEYNKKQILRWYTKNSVIDRLVNNCLRIATSDSILYCRSILKDVERAIREEYHEQKIYNGIVYRAAEISQEEWEKLQQNIGKEIEMHGFLSTSKDLKTAQNYFLGDGHNIRKRALLTIIIPPLPHPKSDEQGFACLNQYSDFADEELLFNVRSKFKILEVGITRIKRNNQDIECRHLVLLYGAQLLRKYMTNQNPAILLKLELPPESMCNYCESRNNLFAYTAETGETQIICQKCFISNGSVPDNTFFLPIDENVKINEEKIINLTVKGKMLEFGQAKLIYEKSLRCDRCHKPEKDSFFKWINLENRNITRECFECFQYGKQSRSGYLLLSESDTQVFWNMHQEKWEEADSEFKTKECQEFEGCSEAAIFYKAQDYPKCEEFCRKSLQYLARKRNKEQEKMTSLVYLAETSKWMGDYKKMLGFSLEAQDIRRFIYGEVHPDTAASYNNIGMIYHTLGIHQKALEYHTRALDIRKLIKGETHPDTAASYNNIGMVSNTLGDHRKALEYHLKALNIRKSINGETHPDTAASYNNLASIYESIGEYKRALDFDLKALEIGKAIYGEKHPNTATSYNNLAMVYNTLGDHQKALELNLKALNIRKSIYGESHPETAGSYNNLATMYEDMGQNQKAVELYLKALKIRTFFFGEIHPNTAASYNNLAMVYHNMGYHQKALELNLKALDITETMYGQSHPKTAVSYNNTGSVYSTLGDYQKALEYYSKALNIMKLISGEEHPDIAIMYSNLGGVYYALKEHKKVLDCFRKAHRIQKSIYGKNHPETAASYHHLAQVYQTLGDDKTALSYHWKALKIKKSAYGEGHPVIGDSYLGLAHIYNRQREHHKALDYHQKALDIHKSAFGDGRETAASYENLAKVYHRLNDHPKALDYHLKALQIRKSLFGESHPDIACSFHNLAKVYSSLEDYEKALDYNLRAFEIRKSTYGETHPIISASYRNFANVYQALGDHQKALELSQKAFDLLKSVYGEAHLQNVLLDKKKAVLEKEQQTLQQALAVSQETFNSDKITIKKDDSNLPVLKRNDQLSFGELKRQILSSNETMKGSERLDNSDKAEHSKNNSTRDPSESSFLEDDQEIELESKNQHFGSVKLISKEEHPEIPAFSMPPRYKQGDLKEERIPIKNESDISGLKQSHEVKKDFEMTAIRELAFECEDLGNFQKALEYHRKALEIVISLFGEMHSEVSTSYRNLALMSNKLGDHQKALEYLLKAIGIQESIPEKDEEILGNLYNNLGLVYESLGKKNEAYESHTKALNTRKSFYEENNPKIAASYNNLAILCEDMGKDQEAIDYHKHVLEIRKNIHKEKENHPDIATSYANLATVFRKLEQYRESLEYQEKAIQIMRACNSEKKLPIGTMDLDTRDWPETAGENQNSIGFLMQSMLIDKYYQNN